MKSLYSDLLMAVKRGDKTFWVVGCIERCGNVATRRMLCQKHYRQFLRNGTLWQYPNLTYLDDYSVSGNKNLSDLINWVYEFNVDVLESGIKEYLTNQNLVLNINYSGGRGSGNGGGGGQPGIHGYVINDQCFNCGDAQFSRGLCKNCYNENRHAGTLGSYPTKDYTDNVQGHVYWLLNNHLDRVIDQGVEWGVEWNETHEGTDAEPAS